MKNIKLSKNIFYVLLALLIVPEIGYPQDAQPVQDKKPVKDCYESREGYGYIERRDIEPALPNVICSQTTSRVLWWGDPYDGTIPMGDMPIEADYSYEEAVVRPREKQLKILMPCTTCHNGKTVPVPKNKKPRPIQFHQNIVPDSLQLMHGRGSIWCLDCHSTTNRDKLISHRDEEISFNQPQKLCGKCHGEVYRDWRDGIHGKRIGSWMKGGKKRWWVCTECHDPHTVQVYIYQPIKPEPAPALPRRVKSTAHETSQRHDVYKEASLPETLLNQQATELRK